MESNVVERMFNRAAIFFPALANLSFAKALELGKVRIGLRPFCEYPFHPEQESCTGRHAMYFHTIQLCTKIGAGLDGRPVIGPVHGFPGLLMATGHEGSGLCMVLTFC